MQHHYSLQLSPAPGVRAQLTNWCLRKAMLGLSTLPAKTVHDDIDSVESLKAAASLPQAYRDVASGWQLSHQKAGALKRPGAKCTGSTVLHIKPELIGCQTRQSSNMQNLTWLNFDLSFFVAAFFLARSLASFAAADVVPEDDFFEAAAFLAASSFFACHRYKQADSAHLYDGKHWPRQGATPKSFYSRQLAGKGSTLCKQD